MWCLHWNRIYFHGHTFPPHARTHSVLMIKCLRLQPAWLCAHIILSFIYFWLHPIKTLWLRSAASCWCQVHHSCQATSTTWTITHTICTVTVWTTTHTHTHTPLTDSLFVKLIKICWVTIEDVWGDTAPLMQLFYSILFELLYKESEEFGSN